MQSSSHIVTTNKPTTNFLQAGCPYSHPTNSVKALKAFSNRITLSLSHPKGSISVLTAIFPGEPGLARFTGTKDAGCWWRQLELQDVQSSSQIITTNKPTTNLLQARCPSCRPTNSVKALKGKRPRLWLKKI